MFEDAEDASDSEPEPPPSDAAPEPAAAAEATVAAAVDYGQLVAPPTFRVVNRALLRAQYEPRSTRSALALQLPATTTTTTTAAHHVLLPPSFPSVLPLQAPHPSRAAPLLPLGHAPRRVSTAVACFPADGGGACLPRCGGAGAAWLSPARS